MYHSHGQAACQGETASMEGVVLPSHTQTASLSFTLLR